MDSVRIVEEFWSAVWKAQNPEAAANFIVDDFVITTGGVEIRGKENFVAWVRDFLQKINDFKFEVMESFQNESGTRVASLWRVTGKITACLEPNRIRSQLALPAQRYGAFVKMASFCRIASNGRHGRPISS
jgi:hypothetical protein